MTETMPNSGEQLATTEHATALLNEIDRITKDVENTLDPTIYPNALHHEGRSIGHYTAGRQSTEDPNILTLAYVTWAEPDGSRISYNVEKRKDDENLQVTRFTYPPDPPSNYTNGISPSRAFEAHRQWQTRIAERNDGLHIPPAETVDTLISELRQVNPSST